MRTVLSMGTFVLVAAGAGCGGGQAQGEGAATAAATPSSAPSSPGADAGSASPLGGPGPATTTTSLAEPGSTQGVKLAEARPADAGALDEARRPTERNARMHEVGRAPADIRAIIVAHRDEARACYDRALKDHPGIEGDLVVTWTIDPKGDVVQTSLDAPRSQITEPTVVDCISGIIRSLHFASSPGGFETKAFYPFNFHPRHTKMAP